MKKVLVTGANGFVGSFLCRELLNSGYQVRAAHRKNSDLSAISDLDLELVTIDLRDPESLKAATTNCEYVFHIAALFREAKHPDQTYYDINVEGTKNLLEAAIHNNVKKVIHCSTVGVHSHIPNPPADESESYRPADIYQTTKQAGEELALEYFRSGKINGIVIRPAMIWGPSDQRTLKLFRGIAKKRMPLICGKTNVHWILVSDLARSFRLAAEKDVPSGEVFIISGKESVSMKRLFAEISKNFNVRPPRFALPAWPFQLLGSIVEVVCKPFGIEPPIYRRRVDFFTKTRSFTSAKAHKLLDFTPEFSFSDEVAHIAQWYKQNNWI